MRYDDEGNVQFRSGLIGMIEPTTKSPVEKRLEEGNIPNIYQILTLSHAVDLAILEKKQIEESLISPTFKKINQRREQLRSKGKGSPNIFLSLFKYAH